MSRKSQSRAEARAVVAVNLRSFAGFWLNMSDEVRRRLLHRAGLVRWNFIREAAELGAKRTANALDDVAVKPVATRCVQASSWLLGATPLPFEEAYAEALLIAQHGPFIPAAVRAALKDAGGK